MTGEVVEDGVTPLPRLAEVGAALPAPPAAVLQHCGCHRRRVSPGRDREAKEVNRGTLWSAL